MNNLLKYNVLIITFLWISSAYPMQYVAIAGDKICSWSGNVKNYFSFKPKKQSLTDYAQAGWQKSSSVLGTMANQAKQYLSGSAKASDDSSNVVEFVCHLPARIGGEVKALGNQCYHEARKEVIRNQNILGLCTGAAAAAGLLVAYTHNERIHKKVNQTAAYVQRKTVEIAADTKKLLDKWKHETATHGDLARIGVGLGAGASLCGLFYLVKKANLFRMLAHGLDGSVRTIKNGVCASIRGSSKLVYKHPSISIALALSAGALAAAYVIHKNVAGQEEDKASKAFYTFLSSIDYATWQTIRTRIPTIQDKISYPDIYAIELQKDDEFLSFLTAEQKLKLDYAVQLYQNDLSQIEVTA